MERQSLGVRTWWLIWSAAAVIWVALAAAVYRHPGPFPIDIRLVRWLQAQPLRSAAAIANDLAYSPVTTLIGIAATVWLLYRRQREAAVFIALAVAVRPLNAVPKAIVQRPRPVDGMVNVIEHASGYSFPSGHTFGSAMLYGAIAIVVFRSGLPKQVRWLATGILMLVIAGCGLARSYVGAHWPTDVGGAWLIAALCLVLLARLAAFVQKYFGPKDHF